MNSKFSRAYFDPYRIARLFEDAGIITKYRYAEMAVYLFRRTRDERYIYELLHRYPQLIAEAQEILMNSPFNPEPKGEEEISRIKGEFLIGYVNQQHDTVGLNPVDFTRGVYVCGEIGSGKTYPVLMLIDQMLAIPKKADD